MPLSKEDIEALNKPASSGEGFGVGGLSAEDLAQLNSGQNTVPSTSVFVPAIKRGFGDYLKSISAAGDLVGLGTGGLADYGKKLEEANPAQTPATLEGLIANPWTAIKERTGEQLANMATTVAGTVAGAVAGGALSGGDPAGAVAGGLAGLAPEAAAGMAAKYGLAKYLGGMAGGAVVDFPNEVGQVALQQKEQGINDPTRALVGGALNTAIEMSPIGVQGMVAKTLGGAAEKTASAIAKETVGKYVAERAAAEAAGVPFAKSAAPTLMRTLAGATGKALSIAAGEAMEEVPQNEISRWSAHQDVLTKQSLQEDIDNAASAFAGSLAFGGAGGVSHQTEVNKATNKELANLQVQDNFKALPEGTQTTIPGTSPEQAKAYVDWASQNVDTLGDKRLSRYGLQSAMSKDATFTDVSNAIKTLETGAPVTALKVAPQIEAVNTQIADLGTKIAESQTKLQSKVDVQQARVAELNELARKTPDDGNVRRQLTTASKKLGTLQAQLEAGPADALKTNLEQLNAKRQELLQKVQPLDLTNATPQVLAQNEQRQKLLDKLHQARGDMAYFQDQAYAKTLEDHPKAADTLTRDMFAEQDAKDKQAVFDTQDAATAQQRTAEFEQAQAQVEAQKQAELDQIQNAAPPNTFSVEAPATTEPTTALGQALAAKNITPESVIAPVAEAAPVATPEAVSTTPQVVAPVAEVAAPAASDNTAKLVQAYQDSGKTAKEAAALVRTLTKNVDINDTQAVSDLLAKKADSNRTQTSFATLDKLHQAVTGVSLNDLTKGEQNVTSTTSQASEKTQTEPQVQKVAVTIHDSNGKTKTVMRDVAPAAQQGLPTLSSIFNPKFSSGQQTVAKGVDQAAAQKVASDVISTFKNAPQYQVVQSIKELSPAEQQELQTTGHTKARGFYLNGKIVIIADNNESLAQVKATVFHEAIGHFGLEQKFRSERDTLMGKIYDTNAEMRKAADAFIARRPGTSKELAIEEVLAKASEGGKLHQSTLSKVVAFIREFARKYLGLNVKYSNNDVVAVLRQAHEAVIDGVNGEAPLQQQQELKYSAPDEAFNDEGYVTSNTELGRKLDTLMQAHPTLATQIKQMLSVGVTGTTSSVLGKGQRVLEKNFQSPLHIASKSKGFSQTWDIVRQIPANAGYILNKAFAPLENTWVKGYDITAARALQFVTGVENKTFQDLRLAEALLHDWNVSGLSRAEYLAAPSTIAQFGEYANNQDWFARVEEARKAIDFTMDASFRQQAEDMREVITDDAEFAQWLDAANKVNEERKDSGYIPIRRYGNYSVAMYDTSKRPTAGFPNGDLGLMGKWFFQNELEAKEFIKELKAQFPDDPDIKLDSDYTHNRPQYIPKAKASQYSYNTISFRQFLETAKRANVPITQAEQQRLARLMINADSMYQNKIQRRKNIPGGSKDIVREISEYITHAANRVASDRLAPRISEAMNITHPLAPDDVAKLSLLQSEFADTAGMSEMQIRDKIHDDVANAGGTMVDEITALARFNKMRELEANGFLAWRTSVDINDPQAVAEYYDLLDRSNALSDAEAARFNELSTPDPQTGFYHDKIVQHVDFLNQPKSEAFANLRRFAAVNFLGGSIASAIVNLSSLPLNFMPYMHQYGGMQAYTTTMHWFSYALKNPLLRNTIFSNNTAELEKALGPEGKLPAGMSREQAQALLRAFREEVVSDTQVFEYFAASKHGVQIGTVLGQRAQAAWMAPFRVSEMLNRVASFMSAYEIAQKNLIDGKQLGSEELYQFARKAVDQTQFIYGPVNRIGIAQNPIGFALMTFRGFSMMSIELLSRLPAKQRTIMLGTLLLASGVGGLPFKDDLLDILDTIGQKIFGVPLNSNRVLTNYFKAASEAMTGTDLSRMIMTGPLDVLTGASVGSRVGLNNLIPATRLGTAGYSLADGMADLGGVIASEAKGVALGAGQLVQGNVSEALDNAAPTGVKAIMRFTQGVNENKLTDKNGNTVASDLTMAELGELAAGFTLSRSNWQNQKNTSAVMETAAVTETTKMFKDHLVDALQKGDTQAMAETFEAINQWNERYPEFAYKITPTSIRKELLDRSLPAGQRELMRIKKAWRADFEDDLIE